MTILLNYLYQRIGKIVYHGPTFQKDFKKDKTIDVMISLINKKLLNFFLKKEDILVEGKSKAPIVGGNIALLIRSLKTKYEIKTRNRVLFLEAWQKDPAWIFDSLWQLKQAKKFDKCRGVILGNFKECGDSLPYLIAFFKNFKIPVILNQKFGHDFPNYTIPIGGICEINTQKQLLKIKQ